jgi:hypothetical protein
MGKIYEDEEKQKTKRKWPKRTRILQSGKCNTCDKMLLKKNMKAQEGVYKCGTCAAKHLQSLAPGKYRTYSSRCAGEILSDGLSTASTAATQQSFRESNNSAIHKCRKRKRDARDKA